MNRLLLALGVITLLITLPLAVFLTTKKQTAFPIRASLSGATLSLVPAQGRLAKGGTKISILATTDNTKVDGADILLTYDSTQISSTRNTLSPGLLFQDPNNKVIVNNIKIDPQTKIASIRFSALFLTPIALNTELASFTVTPLKPSVSTAAITFQAAQGSTSQSAVFDHESSQNILVKTISGEYSY